MQIDLLMHTRERHRPSSTGHLVHRVLPASTLQFWHAERPSELEGISKDRPEFWILHPHGDPLPRDVAPEQVQVLVLDGSWSETSAMSRAAGKLGRTVSLSMTGESRYWLRDQQDGGRFSTAEAVLFLLNAFGLRAAEDALRLQFELHVYANLRARGRKERAAEFLRDSPVRDLLPEIIAQLNVRRPRLS